jgi:hypothetical protein
MGHNARVILLGVLGTPAEVKENLPMLESCSLEPLPRWQLRLPSVTAAAAYGTTENVASVEKSGKSCNTCLPGATQPRPTLITVW